MEDNRDSERFCELQSAGCAKSYTVFPLAVSCLLHNLLRCKGSAIADPAYLTNIDFYFRHRHLVAIHTTFCPV